MDEWLLGFNQEKDFNVSLFRSEKVNLKNAIINTDRVNQELKKLNIPIRLKVGMIGMLSVKTSILNLFSESVKIDFADIHLIFGPCLDHMSNDNDFSKDPKSCFYDCNDQINNISMMHEIIDELEKPLKQ